MQDSFDTWLKDCGFDSYSRSAVEGMRASWDASQRDILQKVEKYYNDNMICTEEVFHALNDVMRIIRGLE